MTGNLGSQGPIASIAGWAGELTAHSSRLVLSYNDPVTEEDLNRAECGEESPPEDDVRQPERPPAAEGEEVAVPILTMSSRDRGWQGGGGLSRWATLGCGAGVVVLVALLAVGIGLTKRTASMAFDRSQQRLMAALEQRNQPAERLRTSRNIERFKTQLRVARDPYPLMGEFMKRVQEDLGDGTLDAAEVEEFNRFLESHLPSAAMTP